MANFFNKNNVSLSQRQQLETRYANARGNLLIVVCFSVINMVLMIAGSDTYFLFSAFVPYILTTFGMLFCGKLGEEWYNSGDGVIPTLDDSFLYIMVAIAVVLVLLYLVSWYFSKKRVGWLIFALVFFIIDTLGMLAFYGFALDSIIDIVFHVWVIVSLCMGINAYFKLKNLPPEEEANETASDITNETVTASSYTPALEPADMSVKARILLETEYSGHSIVYRRVKRVNELVIDGYVYDRIEALIETAHVLRATVDGHLIEVGFDGGAQSYANVDGERIAKKMRLY